MKINIPVNKILVINLGGMGDFLLSYPALAALQRAYPQSKITLLVSGKALEAAQRLSFVDKIFVLHMQSLWQRILSNLSYLLVLRKEGFDLAINMRSVASRLSAIKIRLIFDIINPKISVGRNTEGRARFFDIKIPEDDYGQVYERDYNLKLVDMLGASQEDKTINFTITDSEAQRVKQLLKNTGIKESDILIGIHPGGAHLRRWPLDNYRMFLRSLCIDQRLKFVVTGNKGELKLATQLAQGLSSRVLNLAGKFNLGELAAVIQRCNLYVTNDTGSMHLAAVLRAPLLVVFGGAALKHFDPCILNPQSRVLYKKTVCSPCNRKICYSKKCLKLIIPEEVIQAAKEILSKAG
jgi:heptosyltransferase-2